ncbi:HAMP domain-containing protein [Hoyosella rhizosphaerae]|uniref:Adenylate cyclase n=1 Tax=Hoyosella rhizosphaerae TaxID=1755582 RepID=A0A916XD05_9ACTN|nr:adenylate/guanylate cyclase domain-containing protein [Hoyosella rhizosphaerae]MBN4927661.1 HAMP domain-containing protein [Hoyosella rhizosphaerae]GGC62684.1 putative adenylate cyclase [Hoyosella rhizosphaerae]
MNRWDVLRQLAHPIVLTYIFSVLLVTMISAMTALVLIGMVLPIPVLDDAQRIWETNVGWVFIGLPLITFIAPLVHLKMSWPNLQWLARGGLPRPYEAKVALGQTTRQVYIEVSAWFVALVGFVIINLHVGSVELIILIIIVTSLTGAVSVALNYLIGERMLRPLTAVAMSVEIPEGRFAPGIGPRVVLIWGLTTAIPTAGIVIVSVSQMITGDGQVNPELNSAVLVQCFIAVSIGMIGIVAVSRSISDPLQQVSSAMSRVEAGDLATRVSVYDGSEIGELQAGFNRMVQGLSERERLADLFSKHVGEAVARAAIEDGNSRGGALREVTVLVIDLVGSTALATTEEPEVVVASLNEFFEQVVDRVATHGGFVSKFEGDAAIAVFGAPLEIDLPQAHALACARDLKTALTSSIPLDFGIGVATGTALAGNIGATRRFEYTVLGAPVLMASELSDVAKKHGSRVLANADTVHASGDEAAQWRIFAVGEKQLAEPLNTTSSATTSTSDLEDAQ